MRNLKHSIFQLCSSDFSMYRCIKWSLTRFLIYGRNVSTAPTTFSFSVLLSCLCLFQLRGSQISVHRGQGCMPIYSSTTCRTLKPSLRLATSRYGAGSNCLDTLWHPLHPLGCAGGVCFLHTASSVSLSLFSNTQNPSLLWPGNCTLDSLRWAHCSQFMGWLRGGAGNQALGKYLQLWTLI